MKKILSMFLAFAMVISMLPTMAFAVGDMEIYGELDVATQEHATLGTYAMMDVCVKNSDPVAATGIEFDLPDGFTLKTISFKDSVADYKIEDNSGFEPVYTDAFILEQNVATNRINITTFVKSEEYAFADGILATAYITVDTDTVENGTYSIGISPIANDEGNICNAATEVVPCTFTAGSIVVTNGVEPAPATYTVTLKNGDGTDLAVSEPIDVGTAYKAPPAKAEKTDPAGKVTYTFSHWSTTVGGEEVTNWTFNVDTTLYPVFTESTNTYTVTFEPQNGDATIPVVTNVGDTVAAPDAPAKAETDTETYTFAGWSTTIDGETITDWSTITSGTVYAIYTTVAKTYTVSFKNDGAAYDTSVTANVGTAPETLPVNPTKAGDYTFQHWSTTENGPVVDWTTLPAGEHTVYAVYKSGDGTVNQAYTITTTLDEEEYRSGDTVTAVVSVSAANATNIAGFEMEVDFDSTYVTLGTITDGITDVTQGQGAKINKVFYNAIGDEFVELEAGTPVELFTVTYTVKENVTAEDVPFTVTNVIASPYGYNNNNANHTIAQDTADIIDTVDIILTAGDNGTIGSSTVFILDNGQTIADLKKETRYEEPTPNENYIFNGWADSTNNILDDTYEFTRNTTLKAIFAPNSFDISVANDATDNATVGYQTGVTANKATYNTDVTFTVEPTGNYIISDVAYSVAGGEAKALTADNGTYTIPGKKITGDVTITVSAVKYYEITFKAGTGSTLTETTLYAKSGTAGLYATVDDLKAGAPTASVPTPTANTGYRLAADTAGEALWTDGTNHVTTDWITAATFSADTEYTVKTVKTWVVHFVAGANGSVTDVTGNPYDSGTEFAVPSHVANPGYVFDGWTSDTGTYLDKYAVTETATEDVTYTANFVPGTYDVTFPTIPGVEFTNKTGLNAEGKATYNGEDVTFKITATGLVVDTVNYKIGETEKALTPDANGVYTIPASEITGEVSITVASTDLYTVTFETSENGTVEGTTAFSVEKDMTLGADNLAQVIVTPATGYKFDGWYIGETKYEAPADQAVTAAVTYTAKFTQIHYTFIETPGFNMDYKTGYDEGYAIYDRDVTFTISHADKIVVGVTLMGETNVVLHADENGVYTIPGSAIKGEDNVLSLSIIVTSGTITFIDLEDEYMAKNDEAAARKMMLLSSTTENKKKYTLRSGIELLWSEKYGAYVTMVDDDATVESLSVAMSVDSYTHSDTIDYSGDVNLDGEVNVIDAIIVNDILHGTRLTATDDGYLFRADVNGSKKISATDIVKIKNTVLGIQ